MSRRPQTRSHEVGSIPATGTRRGWGALLIALSCVGFALAAAVVFVVPAMLGTGLTVRELGVLAGGILMGVSSIVLRAGRRMRMEAADWEAIGRDPRPPIVYLRPFEADGTWYVMPINDRRHAPPLWRSLDATYEERLTRALANVGPLIAMANPGEASLEIGAKRLCVEDSEWRQRVADLTSRAGSVIIHAGVSDGLAWEIEHIVGLAMPERVIVALPSKGPRRQPSRQERYGAFVRRFGEVFPRGLPDRVDDSQFLYFDADWVPHRFGHRGGGTVPRSHTGAGDQRARVLERLGKAFPITRFP
jgi:hypothetical protein